MHQWFVTTAPSRTNTGWAGDSGANVRGSDFLRSPAVAGKCRSSDITQITLMEFTIIKRGGVVGGGRGVVITNGLSIECYVGQSTISFIRGVTSWELVQFIGVWSSSVNLIKLVTSVNIGVDSQLVQKGSCKGSQMQE